MARSSPLKNLAPSPGPERGFNQGRKVESHETGKRGRTRGGKRVVFSAVLVHEGRDRLLVGRRGAPKRVVNAVPSNTRGRPQPGQVHSQGMHAVSTGTPKEGGGAGRGARARQPTRRGAEMTHCNTYMARRLAGSFV